jgi:hypothetical protein
MGMIMENWRKYNKNDKFNTLCENHAHGIISEIQLLETWERQVLTEMEQLLDEGVMDVLKIGYEKGKQLVGKAKETWEAAVKKVGEFIFNLCLQAWKLIQTVKDGLAKIAAVLGKALSFLNQWCVAHPLLCKAAKFLLMMLAVAAVMALFSSQAQAAIDISSMPGEEANTILSDTGVDAIKGILQIVNEGKDPEVQQNAVEAFQWLEQAHSSETLVDLANSTEQGAELVRRMFTQVSEIAAEAGTEGSEFGSSILGELANLGERVQVRSYRMSQSILRGGRMVVRDIQWQSLVDPQ